MLFNHNIEGHTTDKSVLTAREEHKAWLMRQLMTSKGHKLLPCRVKVGCTGCLIGIILCCINVAATVGGSSVLAALLPKASDNAIKVYKLIRLVIDFIGANWLNAKNSE